MNDPQITAAVISLMGLIATALIGGVFLLVKQGNTRIESMAPLLRLEEMQTEAINRSAQLTSTVLNEIKVLREDMRDVLKDQKEITMALIKLQERSSK